MLTYYFIPLSARFASGISGKTSTAREALLSAPESAITQWRREKRERLDLEARLSFSAIVAGNKSIETNAEDKGNGLQGGLIAPANFIADLTR